MRKKILSCFAVMQLLTALISAETTHIAYASAWTGGGLAEEINDLLDRIQTQAYSNKQFFELVEMSITPDWGYAYVLYNLSDKIDVTNPLVTHVAYVSGWTGSSIAEELQEKMGTLQTNACNENKEIKISDFKITPEWGYGYIIYEISK